MSEIGRDSPNGAALFEAANKLRGSVESAEYKHLVLGLLFLKYISDAFEQRRGELEAELCDPSSDGYISDSGPVAEVLEDRDEYVAENVFWFPEQARWPALLAAASQPDIARRIDQALEVIERENTSLRNVLPRVYARAPLSAELMGSLVETIAKIGFGADPGEARDRLGRTYEYFIKEFARAAQGPRVRPCLRLLRSVRPIWPVRGGARRPPCRDLRLRSGAQPGDVADRADEPRDPRPVG